MIRYNTVIHSWLDRHEIVKLFVAIFLSPIIMTTSIAFVNANRPMAITCLFILSIICFSRWFYLYRSNRKISLKN